MCQDDPCLTGVGVATTDDDWLFVDMWRTEVSEDGLEPFPGDGTVLERTLERCSWVGLNPDDHRYIVFAACPFGEFSAMHATVAITLEDKALFRLGEFAEYQTDEFSCCIAVATELFDIEAVDIGCVKHLSKLRREERFAATGNTYQHNRVGTA